MSGFPVEIVLFVFLLALGIAVARVRDLFAATMITHVQFDQRLFVHTDGRGGRGVYGSGCRCRHLHCP